MANLKRGMCEKNILGEWTLLAKMSIYIIAIRNKHLILILFLQSVKQNEKIAQYAIQSKEEEDRKVQFFSFYSEG